MKYVIANKKDNRTYWDSRSRKWRRGAPVIDYDLVDEEEKPDRMLPPDGNWEPVYLCHIRDIGIRLNGKYGITGTMQAHLTEREIKENFINLNPPGVMRREITSLDGHQALVDEIADHFGT